jgi:hypothetical protein
VSITGAPTAVRIRLRPEARTARDVGVAIATTDFGLWCVALALWMVSLVRFNPGATGTFGLLSAMPLTMYAALGLLTFSTVRAIFREDRTLVLVAHVALFLLIMHGTPALTYESLRYAWAWKHLGVVDYFARHHAVDPSVTNVGIYQSWPGFFTAATTWLAGSGLTSWTGMAQWAPLAFQALDALAVFALLRMLTSDRRIVWLGVWLFALGNWIGQDYFSPQAFAYFLYLALMIIVVEFLVRRPPMPNPLRRFVRSESSARRASVHAQSRAPSDDARRALAVATILIAAIVSSHPLTPFALLAALLLLAFARVLTVRAIVPIAIACTALWLVTGAQHYVFSNLSDFVEDIGNPSGSVNQSLSKASEADRAQTIVSVIGRGGLAFLALLAVFAFVRHVRNGKWEPVPALLAVAPAAILFGSSYGGEAGFRVYLFALPFLAYFAATACVSGPRSWRRWEPAAALVLSATLMVAFLFGHFGKDQWAHFSRSEVHAAEAMLREVTPGTLIVQATPDYPTGFTKLEDVTYVTIAEEPLESWQKVVNDPENVLTDWLRDPRYSRGFIIITHSQKAQAETLGYLPHGILTRVEAVLLRSPNFRTVYHDADATVVTTAQVPQRGRR